MMEEQHVTHSEAELECVELAEGDSEVKTKEERPDTIGEKYDTDRNAWTKSLRVQRLLVTLVHVIFVTFSVVSHFIYEWSGDSDFAAWLSPIDESVVQHLKMMFWPWLVLLVPLDVLTKIYFSEGSEESYWYIRQVKTTTWLNLCQANLVSLTIAMLFVAGVFRLYTAWADVSHNLPADIITFMVAVCVAPVMRIWLDGHENLTGWLLWILFLYGQLWFYVYFSYADNVHYGFWFDPHEDSEDEVNGE